MIFDVRLRPLRTLGVWLCSCSNDPKRTFLLFTALYLLSFAVLTGWVLLLAVGLLSRSVRTFANEIAIPLLLGSVICLEGVQALGASG